MEKCNQQQKHPAPVMNIADEGSEKHVLLQIYNRIIGAGRGGNIIEPEHDPGEYLDHDQYCSHSTQPEGPVELKC